MFTLYRRNKGEVKTNSRFVFRKQHRVFLKVSRNGLQVRVAVIDHNAEEQPFAFYLGVGLADGEAMLSGIAFEPSEEETVTGFFPPVARVAHIEQHLLIGAEELVDDGKDSGFYLSARSKS